MTPEVAFGNLPPVEAINHLRQKLNITTEHWDDMLKEIRGKAFTIAGATKLALLQDLRGAVDKAVADGESIGQFRNRFDGIIKEHGWEFRGNYAWRTRVIYDTNLRTAHMAGKWEQIQRGKATRPYLQYRTASDKRVRPEHAQWDDLILPVDDPFWDTHYPPNGWGCRCTTRTLSRREMERKSLKVDDTPEIIKTERTNTRTGEVYGQVPEGIDVGWDYNVGKAWLGAESSWGALYAQQSPAIQQQLDAHSGKLSKLIQDRFKSWLPQASKDQVVAVGYLNSSTMPYSSTGSATIVAQVGDIADKDMAASIPALLTDPLAIVRQLGTNTLFYITSRKQQSALAIQVKVAGRFNKVVEIDWWTAAELLDKDRFEAIVGKL